MQTPSSRGIPRVLPDPCPECAGPVEYAGFGRLPKVCRADACKRAAKARADAARYVPRSAPAGPHKPLDMPPHVLAYAKARYAARGHLARSTEVVAEEERRSAAAAKREPLATWVRMVDPSDDLTTPDDHWHKNARPRRDDAAAAWLAEHGFDLDDFGPDA